jgi:hypothetical protein
MTSIAERKEKKWLDAQFPESPLWRKTRKLHKMLHPRCAACPSLKRSNEVHHIIPRHEDPKLELDPTNLITLCETDHLVFGHLRSWKSWNPDVVKHAREHYELIKSRPKSKTLVFYGGKK